MDTYEMCEKIERECLSRALELIKKEAVLTAGTVGTVTQLVKIAREMQQVKRPIPHERELWGKFL